MIKAKINGKDYILSTLIESYRGHRRTIMPEHIKPNFHKYVKIANEGTPEWEKLGPGVILTNEENDKIHERTIRYIAEVVLKDKNYTCECIASPEASSEEIKDFSAIRY